MKTEKAIVVILVINLLFPTVHSFPEGNFTEIKLIYQNYKLNLILRSDGGVNYNGEVDATAEVSKETIPFWLMRLGMGLIRIDEGTIDIYDIQHNKRFSRMSKLNSTDCRGTYQFDYDDKAIYFCIQKTQDKTALYNVSFLIKPEYGVGATKNGDIYRWLELGIPESKESYHILARVSVAEDLRHNPYPKACPDDWESRIAEDYIECEKDDLNSSKVHVVGINLNGTLKSYIEKEELKKKAKKIGQSQFVTLLAMVIIGFLNFYFTIIMIKEQRSNLRHELQKRKKLVFFIFILLLILAILYSHLVNEYP